MFLTYPTLSYSVLLSPYRRYNDDFEEHTLQETSYRRDESSSYHEYDSEMFM